MCPLKMPRFLHVKIVMSMHGKSPAPWSLASMACCDVAKVIKPQCLALGAGGRMGARLLLPKCTGWWYTYPSEKIWKSIGMIILNIWGKKKVPNHQPVYNGFLLNMLNFPKPTAAFLDVSVSFWHVLKIFSMMHPKHWAHCPIFFLQTLSLTNE